MADLTLSCPHCQQFLTCDDQWAGQQIACPTCQGALSVPAKQAAAGPSIATASEANNPLVPKPPGGVQSKLSLGGASQQPAVAGNRNIPIRNLAPPKTKKKSPLPTILGAVVAVAVLGVGGYFGFSYLKQAQDKQNAQSKKEMADSDGGQVGHIAALNDVLDRTEPGNVNLGGPRGSTHGPRQRSSGVGEAIPVPGQGAPAGATEAAGTVDASAPLIPALWTLELDSAKIPSGRVNGSISSSNFVAETIRIDPVGNAQVLRLVQGPLLSPERELLVYLHLKPGEKLGGQSLNITKETRGGGIPTVSKRWKTNPKYAPTLKSFSYGYALKLELGALKDGTIPGKIFVSLPDSEKSVVAGTFSAATSLPEIIPAAAAVAAPAAVGPGVPRAGRVSPTDRYGVAP